jgi:hypothetical protein
MKGNLSNEARSITLENGERIVRRPDEYKSDYLSRARSYVRDKYGSPLRLSSREVRIKKLAQKRKKILADLEAEKIQFHNQDIEERAKVRREEKKVQKESIILAKKAFAVKQEVREIDKGIRKAKKAKAREFAAIEHSAKVRLNSERYLADEKEKARKRFAEIVDKAEAEHDEHVKRAEMEAAKRIRFDNFGADMDLVEWLRTLSGRKCNAKFPWMERASPGRIVAPTVDKRRADTYLKIRDARGKLWRPRIWEIPKNPEEGVPGIFKLIE